MIRAVFFDFDGLVLDTAYPEFLSWQEKFQEYDCYLAPETWVAHTGEGASSIAFSPQAFALEDSANGVAAAKQAGLCCVAVPNRLTRHCCLDRADLVINSLAEVTLQQLTENLVLQRTQPSG